MRQNDQKKKPKHVDKPLVFHKEVDVLFLSNTTAASPIHFMCCV